MDVKKLYRLALENPDASKKAAVGFEERLAKREKEFAEEAKKLKPGPGFYERRYDI